MAGIPAISGFGAPGAVGIPSGVIGPAGSFKLPAGLALGAGASPAGPGAGHAGAPQARGRGPLDVSNQVVGAYGVPSSFNPMMLLT